MAYLALSNGMVFEGKRMGAQGSCKGEMILTTGVVGYLETLSDPCNAGKIVMQTFPMIGNYGVISEDLESDIHPAGYVVRELCDSPSNFRSQGELDAFLKANGICGICGVDTREITRILREEGEMTAVICDELPDHFDFECKTILPSPRESRVYPALHEKKYAVTVLDYGVKKSLIQYLCGLGCEVKTVPFDTGAEEILKGNPDGIILSSGSGNPAMINTEEIRKLMGQKPMWGIGLGHLLMAKAMGAVTFRMRCGHHGSNQPAKDLRTQRTYMSSQNHSDCVDANAIPDNAEIIFRNVNDGTCEGLSYPSFNAISTQFEPDTINSFTNTSFLFDRFIAMMGGKLDA